MLTDPLSQYYSVPLDFMLSLSAVQDWSIQTSQKLDTLSIVFYIYCSVHHNILLEITNRCNCMQWILFLCLVHSICFGWHTRPSWVQISTVSTATGTIIGWRRLSRLLVPEGARHLLYNAPKMLPANGRQHRGCIIPQVPGTLGNK